MFNLILNLIFSILFLILINTNANGYAYTTPTPTPTTYFIPIVTYYSPCLTFSYHIMLIFYDSMILLYVDQKKSVCMRGQCWGHSTTIPLFPCSFLLLFHHFIIFPMHGITSPTLVKILLCTSSIVVLISEILILSV